MGRANFVFASSEPRKQGLCNKGGECKASTTHRATMATFIRQVEIYRYFLLKLVMQLARLYTLC